MNKALFLDLDWTLIRPKSYGSSEYAITLDASDQIEAEAYAAAEKKIPRGATEIEAYNDFTDDGQHRVVGYKYRNVFPVDATDWEFVPGMIQAIRPYLVEEGFLLVIVSNQGGIASGFHTTAEVAGKLHSVLNAAQAALSAPAAGKFFFCPSLDKDDYQRKPNPGMVIEAQNQLNLDLSLSLFIGDMDSDRECAKRAGVSYMDVKEFLRTHGPA